MQDIVRDEFGFKGYVISDEGAVENIYSQVNLTKKKHFLSLIQMSDKYVTLKYGIMNDFFKILISSSFNFFSYIV